MEDSKKHPPAYESQEKSEDKQDLSTPSKGSPESQTNNTLSTQPATESDLEQAEHNIEVRMSAFERSMIRVTRAGVVVAVITCIIFLGQFYEMYTGSRDTHILALAAKKQADKAETISSSLRDAVSDMDAANANARKALDATIVQAEISERAWLSVTVAPYPNVHFEVGKPLDIRVTITNTGKTPALDVRSATYRTTINRRDSPSLTLPKPVYTDKDYAMGGTVFPNSHTFGDLVYLLTPEDVRRIDSMEVRIYVYGRIRYEDVFGSHHWVDFCTFLLPGSAFAIYRKYNGIDRNSEPNNPN